MSAGRRSGRLKGPRAVYVDDPFEAAGLSDNEEESNKPKVSSRRKGKRAEAEDLSSDDEFVAGSGDEVDYGLDEDEVGTDAADDPEGELGSQGGASEPEEMWIGAAEGTLRKERSGFQQRDTHARKRRADAAALPNPDETHSRGIIEPKDHLSKTAYYTLTFGTDDRDLMAAVHFRMRWNKALDVAFPSRATLEDREQKPSYLYGPTFGVHPDDMLRESTRGWDWYYDRDTGPIFKKKQRIHNLEESMIFQRYLPPPDARKHGILLGPHNNQQLYKLGYHETFDFGKAWSTQPGQSETGTRKIREGWILNIGHKALCMAWAPNQDGLTQYLAVVAPITEAQKAQCTPEGSEPTTPFRPSHPTPSALQIWEFKGKKSETPTITLDMETKPRLRQVLCADWGDLRRMSWNSMPRAKREEDEEEARKSIGLLATVWGDGKVRVLDIKTERGSQKTEYLKVESPAFEARPPATVCTCVTWLSPGDLAVGCGNGFVAVWNIKPCSEPEPLPYFYRPVHDTYILSITSAYPAHPQLIITVAMDGETRMWSTIDSSSEMASTVRMRGASAYISYSPLCQSVIAGDENEFARIIPIRRFISTTVIARFTSNISAMAPSSTHHPCALFGSTAGEVAGTNPFRRILYNKEQVWQQMWFTHEWVRPTSETDTLGISRFYDGYRAENQKLAKNKMSESKPIMGMGTSTIYEEGTHVTALGWNPNRHCAGWASAALGCGLLRVEDLAI